MEAQAPDKSELTPQQKAAIVLSTLGPEGAAPLLRKLSEEDVRTFARASSEIRDVSKETVEKVLKEFIDGLNDDGLTMTPDRLKRLLGSIMSEDAIERILEDMHDSDTRSIWEKLSQTDPAELALFLSREHPQTAAVVLSRIKPDRSAKVMMKFEQDFADEVVIRLSKVSQLAPSVMEAVRDAIEGEFLRSARQKKSKRKPDELLGSIFNYMTNDKRDVFLTNLEEASQPLAQAVQRKMFTIGDVAKRVDRANVSVLVRECENEVLIKALALAKKNAAETFDFMLNNISKRLAEQIREQIMDQGEISAKEGEEAQFELIALIRRLSERGVITLIKPDDEDDAEDF
ncbi:MAG: FliG C-terminal domain-containing protein [Pseudomonadota bacterium]